MTLSNHFEYLPSPTGPEKTASPSSTSQSEGGFVYRINPKTSQLEKMFLTKSELKAVEEAGKDELRAKEFEQAWEYIAKQAKKDEDRESKGKIPHSDQREQTNTDTPTNNNLSDDYHLFSEMEKEAIGEQSQKLMGKVLEQLKNSGVIEWYQETAWGDAWDRKAIDFFIIIKLPNSKKLLIGLDVTTSYTGVDRKQKRFGDVNETLLMRNYYGLKLVHITFSVGDTRNAALQKFQNLISRISHANSQDYL